MNSTSGRHDGGLSLTPLRGLRPRRDGAGLAGLLCPPYDVIDPALRRRLLDADPDNAVAVVLPEPDPAGYAQAAERLSDWVQDGSWAVDESPSLYVYEMTDRSGQPTRGLVGALELRDPADGVILPHENTMAGPVADRLAVMTATGTDLEAIYLVYDGGGAASELVRTVGDRRPIAEASTPDGVTHRLWVIDDPAEQQTVAADLADRRALIADGHHRYATYRERQRRRRATDGAGPWDRGLALLVDSLDYGPQVHPIHRVITALALPDALARLQGRARAVPAGADPERALAALAETPGFATVLTDGTQTVVVDDPDGALAALAARPGEPAGLAALDVSVVHRALVEQVWGLPDDADRVRYAHSVDEAIRDAAAHGGVAILLRPTPIPAVAAVAAAGARMPRKSTLFTPKPASGLVMRRLADQA